MLKDKFPNNCAWEEPKSNTRINGEEFENNCRRAQGSGDMDISEDTNNGLYSKALPRISTIDYHWIPNIDL